MKNSLLQNSAFETVAEAYNRNADKYDEFIENNPNLIWEALRKPSLRWSVNVPRNLIGLVRSEMQMKKFVLS